MKIERQKFTRTMPDDAEIVATQVFGPIPLRRCAREYTVVENWSSSEELRRKVH